MPGKYRIITTPESSGRAAGYETRQKGTPRLQAEQAVHIRLMPFLIDLFAVKDGRLRLGRLWLLSSLLDDAEDTVNRYEDKF